MTRLNPLPPFRMNRLFSISVIFQSITAVMAVILVAVCGLGAQAAFERRQTDERLLRIVDVSRDLFGAMQEIRLERGGLDGALASAVVYPPQLTPAMAAARAQTNRSLDAVFAKLASDPSPETRSQLAQIRAQRAIYDALHAKTTAELRLPRDRRTPGLGQRWIAVDNAMVAATGGLAHRLAAEVSADDPIVSEMMKMKQLVWWSRDAAGANDALLSRALGVGGKLSAADEIALASQAGRSDEAWTVVRDEARMPTIPDSLKAAVARANKVYFTDFEAMRQVALDDLAAGRPVSIPHQVLAAGDQAGLASLMAVATTAFDLSQAHARLALAQADRDAGVAAALVGLAMLLGLSSLLYISRRIVHPIARITAAMGDVAGGDLDRDIPFQARGDEIGALARALGVFRRNALEKRRMEDELVKSRVATQAAEAASRLKSQFLANMSHEIRTPLNGVLGMVQVMEQERLEPLQAERLSTIRDSGRALLQILNDVLDLSKIEAGELELSRQEFDVVELVERTCAAFSGAAEAKGLTLTTALDNSAGGVWMGDAARLRQILSNLISNALKFTDAGSVTLAAACRDAGLSFEVRDSGIGISPEDLPRLFSKFSQVDDSNTRRFGGTGLGLAISRELAQMMGGDIEVESQAGVGSVFRVTVPLVRVRDAAPLQPVAAAVDAEPSPGAERPARILAAEDNPTNQKVLAALLSPLGVELTIVDDGQAAIDRWRAGGFDLILMDIQMPGVSGLAAARAIREAEAERGLTPTPIVALSANAMSHQVDSYLAAGMNAHVAKPIEAGVLYRTIGEVLAASQAAEATETAEASVA